MSKSVLQLNKINAGASMTQNGTHILVEVIAAPQVNVSSSLLMNCSNGYVETVINEELTLVGGTGAIELDDVCEVASACWLLDPQS